MVCVRSSSVFLVSDVYQSVLTVLKCTGENFQSINVKHRSGLLQISKTLRSENSHLLEYTQIHKNNWQLMGRLVLSSLPFLLMRSRFLSLVCLSWCAELLITPTFHLQSTIGVSSRLLCSYALNVMPNF